MLFPMDWRDELAVGPRRERTLGANRADRAAKQAVVVAEITGRDPVDRLVVVELTTALLALHPLRIECVQKVYTGNATTANHAIGAGDGVPPAVRPLSGIDRALYGGNHV